MQKVVVSYFCFFVRHLFFKLNMTYKKSQAVTVSSYKCCTIYEIDAVLKKIKNEKTEKEKIKILTKKVK